MTDTTLEDARSRLGAIAAALADAPEAGEIRAGFAERADGETATHLITRADRELVAGRVGGRRLSA
jgi:hypothetical protein